MNRAWDKASVSHLRELLSAGKSREEIAKRLRRDLDDVRAQIELLAKFGLASAIRSIDDIRDRRFHVKQRESKVQRPAASSTSVPPTSLSTSVDLAGRKGPVPENRQCSWIEGDPRENWKYCGRWTIAPGKSYCEEHSSLSTVRTGRSQNVPG